MPARTSLRDSLASIQDWDSSRVLAPFRALVRSALRRGSGRLGPDDDRVEEVLASLLHRLLELRSREPKWRCLLGLPEEKLRGFLARAARRLAMDLDPDRKPLRALAQVVSRVLRGPLPTTGNAPLSLRSGDQFHPPAVAAAVAWVLARDDAPNRKPYPLARYLFARWSCDAPDDVGPAPAFPDPALAAEAEEHAARVARELEVRLAPEEAIALDLRLRGEPLETVADSLGCRRTKAHALSTRAREAVGEVVAEIEEEWLCV